MAKSGRGEISALQLQTNKFRIMIQNFDCRGQRMMERIIADRQTIYNRVEFISWRNNTLALFLA